jgi:hypothetical protein
MNLGQMLCSRLVAPVLLLAACGGGVTFVDPPPPPSGDFVLTFRPDVEDQASAQALGWGTAVPDADVTLTPKDPTLGTPQTYRTSATGTVTVAALTAGDYVVDIKHWLSDTERGRLAAGDNAIGFVTKTIVRAGSGVNQAFVSVPASRRRSLIISEFANNYLNLIPDAYRFNSFVELHNNSDTTIYVDGMILARSLSPSANYPNFPCTLYAPYSGDAGGVWARFMVKFPGTGRDYPVQPDETIVVATDAIDHSAIVAGGLDLRSARFEMMGPSDVDNPAAANMIDITDGGFTASGHGMAWEDNLSMVITLSRPVDTSTLPLAPPTIAPFRRLPGELILDVFSYQGSYQGDYPHCPRLVHANFDRERASSLFDAADFVVSAHRKTVMVGGHKFVQNSRNSFTDFIAAPRSPGVLP